MPRIGATARWRRTGPRSPRGRPSSGRGFRLPARFRSRVRWPDGWAGLHGGLNSPGEPINIGGSVEPGDERMAANRIHDLALIIEDLDAMGRLIRVRSEVDPAYELAGIAAEFEGGPRALLFEK